MKTRLCITTVTAIVAVAIGATDFAFGAGGRGGGSGGGAVAVARPSGGSSPSLNRPSDGGAASRPASSPVARPSTGSGAKPNGGGGNVATGNRPSVQPGTQPNVAAGAGARPATLPSNRPGIGSGQGIGTGTGVTSRPAAGDAKSTANLPGVSQQPTRLPGLGQAGAGTRLPNQGAGLQDRPQSLQARQNSLNDRMASARDDGQGNRQTMQSNRQDYRTSNREDWQNYADDHHNQYGNWYHDSWYPGAGWNQMWNNYPVAAAFGVTAWGVNRLAYGFGYWGYSNPYSGGGGGSGGGYDYSQPLVAYSDSGTSTTPADPAAVPTTTQPEPSDVGMTAFNDARAAFYDGDAAKALTLLDITLKTMPKDTVVHEFRGLVLFALKKYPESAAAIYAVLSAGPGWDWTTMSGLYPNVDVYTQQLRALEDFAKTNPNSADGHFLLGYHYLTGTHAETALKQFQLAQKQLPDDKLLMQLIDMTTPPDESKKPDVATPPAPQSIAPEKVLTAEKLVGQWKASSQGASFQLDLAKDGSFAWTYSRGKDTQTVKGVFAVDQNNLALEPNSGGTMLAEVNLTNPSQFVFKMIGGEANDPGLQFKKI